MDSLLVVHNLQGPVGCVGVSLFYICPEQIWGLIYKTS